jgi:hypothetical protein
MRVIRTGWMVAVMMSVLVVSSGQAVPEEKSDADIWGDPEISAAVKKACKGQSEDLDRISSKLRSASDWKPVKKNLPKYHEYLGVNNNPHVQLFAVAAIARLRDNSSISPLKAFIVAAKKRLQEGTLTDEEMFNSVKEEKRKMKGDLIPTSERIALSLAVSSATATLGEIDDSSDLSVAFLGTLLKHDMGKEWGGGVAHSALVKKGASGLRRLLEASLTADEKQIEYVCSAISEVRDPKLIPNLYAACLNKNYPLRVRASALFTLEGLRASSADVEDLIISILMDEESDIRNTAAVVVCRFGTTKGREVLEKVQKNPGKSGGALVQAINDDLLQYDTENTLGGVIKTILAPETTDSEKKRLCYNIKIIDTKTISKYATNLVSCLNVQNSEGKPLNEARIEIWLALYRSTKIMYPLTLMPYKTDRRFELATSEMRSLIRTELERYSTTVYKSEKVDLLVRDSISKFITISATNAVTREVGDK